MIAKLRGIVDEIGPDWVIIDAGGVGYLVFCSSRTLSILDEKEGPVSVWIETHVREDHIHLYGFSNVSEKDWFNLLTTVQGVGTKVGLALLSSMSVDELKDALITQDAALFTQAQGVGPRLAARILTELKNKAGTLLVERAGNNRDLDPKKHQAVSDAVSALVNLGYKRPQALEAVGKAAKHLSEGSDMEELLVSSLKELSK